MDGLGKLVSRWPVKAELCCAVSMQPVLQELDAGYECGYGYRDLFLIFRKNC